MQDYLVPLRDALGASERADFELSRVPADREVDDGDIFRLAGARGDDGAETGAAPGVERGTRFGDGARLIRLDQDRVVKPVPPLPRSTSAALVTR